MAIHKGPRGTKRSGVPGLRPRIPPPNSPGGRATDRSKGKETQRADGGTDKETQGVTP